VSKTPSSSHVSSRSSSRIVQRSGRTEVFEDHESTEGSGDEPQRGDPTGA
jgi:hypothetical protein